MVSVITLIFFLSNSCNMYCFFSPASLVLMRSLCHPWMCFYISSSYRTGSRTPPRQGLGLAPASQSRGHQGPNPPVLLQSRPHHGPAPAATPPSPSLGMGIGSRNPLCTRQRLCTSQRLCTRQPLPRNHQCSARKTERQRKSKLPM